MLQQLGIRQRFRLLLVFSLACFALCGAIVYHTLSEIRVNGPLYQRIMQGQDLVADILPPPAYILESYLVTLQMEAAGDAAQRRRLLERLRQLEREYQARLHHWQDAGLTGELASSFLHDSDALVREFYAVAYRDLAPALERNDRSAIGAALARLGGAYERQRAVIGRVVQLAQVRNHADEAAAYDRMQVMAVALALVFALTVIVFVFIFDTVQRSIADPIIDVLNITRKIAAGDWSQQLSQRSQRGEAGHLMAAIRDIVRNTQAELVKSDKLAALGSLVAGVSHELNTPVGNGLMAVSTLSDDAQRFRNGMGAGLKRSVLEDFLGSVEMGAEIALRNLQRAAELISSFKQVAVDRSSSQRRRFQLQQLAHETQLTLLPTLKLRQCNVRLDVPDTIWLDSFPGPLGQVLSNMIDNAALHAFDGVAGGTVTVSARLLPGRVRIRISDRGKGMAPEVQRHVFDPFFTTRLGQGGNGLGLHIAHNIVYQMLGGSIALVSGEGAGTRFDIVIPLDAPADPAA